MGVLDPCLEPLVRLVVENQAGWIEREHLQQKEGFGVSDCCKGRGGRRNVGVLDEEGEA